ncbi:alpha-1,2-mannosidase MNL1 [Rhodotorula paludigena]|uniref:alpha-1,2-mannosidase MNL1 n=1 Tax=Rhodotorula paludigena TaxID=86838 RepID=UPI003178BEF8
MHAARWHTLVLLLALVLLVPTADGARWYSSEDKEQLRQLAKETWYHAYNSYKRVAFPADELLPLSCGKQGHDRANTENTGVNDVMGDYLLTVVDSLDTFPILGDYEGFEQAVRETIQHVDFDVDSRVQVFEVTIRMMGGLLSGHLLAMPSPPPGTPPSPSTFASSIRGFSLPWYRSELLHLAHDLGRRLLPAFETPTGIPFARVHLQRGLRGKNGKGESGETCSAGAGSLLLEFITLSRLTGDPTFELVARRAFFAIWNSRSDIGLIGNTIDARTGNWMHGVAGTGAGIDSFYEYAAKAYVLTGEDEYLRVWEEGYAALQRYVRAPDGFWYRGVNMHTGQMTSVLVDSLSAFLPGVQTLLGDLDSATRAHAPYAFAWLRYSGLPELFDTHRRAGAGPQLGYPLRPEFIESNMYLYQATGDEWYLEVAERVLHDINNRTRVECGFAAVKDLRTGELEDKMPSFVTGETLKYLYLTFDENSPFLRDDSAFVFTTEGHPLEIPHPPPSTSPSRRSSRSKRAPSAPSSPDSASSSNTSASPPLRNETALAPTCTAHEPIYDERYAHFLALGMDRRTDWEHARWLAGHTLESEADVAREIAEGRWRADGFCDLPAGEDPNLAAARVSHSLDLLHRSVLDYFFSRTASESRSPAAAASASPVAPLRVPIRPVVPAPAPLLFAPSTSHEVTSPSASQLTPHPSGNGDVVVHSIAGLRFSLHRAYPGADGYAVTRVGGLAVPPGRSVVLRDRKVLKGLPGKRVERIALEAIVGGRSERPPRKSGGKDGGGAGRRKLNQFLDRLMHPLAGGTAALSEQAAPTALAIGDAVAANAEDTVSPVSPPRTLHLPALAASFGPTLAFAPPASTAERVFALDGFALPLVLPRFSPYGCEPHHPPASSPSSVAPHLLLLHRGQCSFALKAHLAALSGASGVVLVSSALPTDDDLRGDGFVVPSAEASEEDDETMKALVPLVLVANSTGTALEEMLRAVGDENERRREVAKVPPTSGQDQEPQHVFEAAQTAAPLEEQVVWMTASRGEEGDEEEEEEEHVGPLVLGGYLTTNIKLHRGKVGAT